MATEPFQSSRLPKPKAPYSQAMRAGGFLFISGQVGVDPQNGELITSSFEAQAEQVLSNLQWIVEDAGGLLSDVVKTTVFLTDIKRFAAFNEVYARFFPESPPARSAFEASQLPFGAEVEVEAIVWLGS